MGGQSGGFGGFSSASASAGSSQSFRLSSQSFGGLSLNRQQAPIAQDSFPDSIGGFTTSETDPAPVPKIIEIRKTFPETWLFDNLEFNST